MATKKKNVVTEVASALGAAAARVESLKPKRAAASAKHTKAQSAAQALPVEVEISQPPMSEREEVELVAYLYAEARGFQNGHPAEDWMRAEQEVRRRRSSNS